MKGNYFYDHFLSSFWILAMHFHYMESKSVDIFLLCLMEDVKYLRVRTTWGWVIITKTYKSIPLYSPTQDLVSNRVSYWCKAWLKKSLCSLMDHSVLFFFLWWAVLKHPLWWTKQVEDCLFICLKKTSWQIPNIPLSIPFNISVCQHVCSLTLRSDTIRSQCETCISFIPIRW